jgi:hypothetical protein
MNAIFGLFAIKAGNWEMYGWLAADVSVSWRAEMIHDLEFRMTDDWNPRHPLIKLMPLSCPEALMPEE